MSKRARVDDEEAEAAKARHLAWYVEGFIEEAIKGGIPPSVDGAEAGTIMFLGGLALVAKGMVLMLPASSEDDLRAQLRSFLDAREPRVEAALIELALEVWRGVQG